MLMIYSIISFLDIIRSIRYLETINKNMYTKISMMLNQISIK